MSDVTQASQNQSSATEANLPSYKRLATTNPLLAEMRARRLRRAAAINVESDVDPLTGLTNLFDVAMVFAVALMVALVSYLQVPSLLKESDYTIITNPGKPDMEIVVKEGQEIKHYEASESTGAGQGELLGQAYRLPDGRVIYVPADEALDAAAQP